MTSLATQNLTLAATSKLLVFNLNLTIEPGQTLGILGCNGSGKTTLLHTLAGLRNANQGTVQLNGRPLQSISRQAIARKIGILLQQDAPTFTASVLETVLAGRYPHQSGWYRETAEDLGIAHSALEAMHLTDYENRCITTLSGGEQRRVSIATLLAQAPDIYLLDEPTNHLDLYHQLQVLNHFHSLARHRRASLIIALHDINLANQFCNHTLMLLKDGQFLLGPTTVLINAENLELLYQIPFINISTTERPFWQPIPTALAECVEKK